MLDTELRAMVPVIDAILDGDMNQAAVISGVYMFSLALVVKGIMVNKFSISFPNLDV